MMSLGALNTLRREAASRAARRRAKPLLVPLWLSRMSPEVRTQWLRSHSTGIPNFGDYRPKGWYVTRVALVDKFGVGDRGMSYSLAEMMESLAKPGEGLASIEEGQFQMVVASFAKGVAPDDHEVERLIGIMPGTPIAIGGGTENN